MKILVLSDIHGRTDNMEKIRDTAGEADLVLVAGDISHFGGADNAERILYTLRTYNPHVKAVAGNCDNRQIEEYLEQENMLLDRRAYQFNGIRFIGLSGALPGPVRTPYETSEESISRLLGGVSGMDNGSTVLISHQPPFRTIADRAMKLHHVGSRSVRDWIEKNTPRLVVCGHIHESYGYKQLGPTHIVNPGAWKEGRYALVELSAAETRIEISLEICD